MLSSTKVLARLNKLNAIFRAYSSKSSTTGSSEGGLSSFLNVVQSTEKELKEKLTIKDDLEEKNLIKDRPTTKFTTLLRYSELIKLGYIKKGFVTKGLITKMIDNTVFIDYGGKFMLISQKPEAENEFYVRGAEVLVKIFDWEMTARFIGAETDSTLCESDGYIIKLLNSPFKANRKDSDNSSNEEIDNYLKNLEANLIDEDKK